MNFTSVIQNYNRLLFPHEDYVFSDFEGLGVGVSVQLYHYDQNGQIDYNLGFTSKSGGVEFGHK